MEFKTIAKHALFFLGLAAFYLFGLGLSNIISGLIFLPLLGINTLKTFLYDLTATSFNLTPSQSITDYFNAMSSSAGSSLYIYAGLFSLVHFILQILVMIVIYKVCLNLYDKGTSCMGKNVIATFSSRSTLTAVAISLLFVSIGFFALLPYGLIVATAKFIPNFALIALFAALLLVTLYLAASHS